MTFDAQWGSKVYTIKSADTPFILENAEVDDAEVFLRAHEDNTGTIKICGDSGVTVGGWPLSANQEIPPIRIAKANKIWISGDTVGDKIYVLYTGGINGNTNKLLANILIELRKLGDKMGVAR